MAQNIFVKVALIVDLVDELVDAGRGLSSRALGWLWTDDLAIVDDKFLVERGYDGVSRS